MQHKAHTPTPKCTNQGPQSSFKLFDAFPCVQHRGTHHVAQVWYNILSQRKRSKHYGGFIKGYILPSTQNLEYFSILVTFPF